MKGFLMSELYTEADVRGRPRMHVLAFTVALAVSGCAGQASPSDSDARATPGMSPAADEGTEPFAVEVDGLTIVGHCSGTRDPDDPAILLQHGNGGSQGHLAATEDYLAESALVCAYDRPGGRGDSDSPTERPRSVTEVAEEARAVLAAVDIEPPFFLIGQSAGGAISTVFAHLYPVETAGFVASNPNPPFTAWIEAASNVQTAAEIESREMPDYLGQNPEGIDMRANDIMLEPLPDSMPYAVLFDEDCGGAAFCDQILESLAATQALIAESGAGGRFIWVEGAGHEIPDTAPDEMRAAIEEVWAEATD
jgi:pimeloyl-ACP methyl ester carboxylesterase